MEAIRDLSGRYWYWKNMKITNVNGTTVTFTKTKALKQTTLDDYYEKK